MTGRYLIALALCACSCAGVAAEGRPWIHAIRFEGLDRVQRSALVAKLGMAATSWNPLAARIYLDPFALAQDEERVLAFCHARGFYGARVVRAEVVPRPGGKSVDVHFVVEEGEPTRIERVLIEDTTEAEERTGMRAPHLDAALSRLTLAAGQVFDSDKYLEEKEIIAGTLKDIGYPWARVRAEADVDRDKRVAVVRYTVEHGLRADWSGVRVEGTERVDAVRVAAETRVEPGERFRLSAVDDARGKVYHLGVFSTVKVGYEAVEGRPDRVRMVVGVKESTFNEVRLGLGFGIDALHTEVHVDAIYVRHNFLGGLRTLQLRLTPAYSAIPAFWDIHRQGPALTAEGVLTQPRVAFLSQIQLTVGYDLGLEYAYQFQGPRASLGVTRQLWRDRFSVGLSYNIQLLSFFYTDPAILEDPAQAGRFFGFVDPYRVAWWQQDVVLDLRNRALDTSKGMFASLSLEEGGDFSGSAFEYEKLRGDLRGYLPIGSRVVLAARAQFGEIHAHGDLGSPISRRFYLGGPNSHRGFNYGRLSLQVPSGTPGSDPIPVGGDEMFLAQAELRVNLITIGGAWLSAAAFFDTGDVAAPSCGSGGCPLLPSAAGPHVDFRRLHHAVGGGLRMKTIIGTLRADLGVRLNRLAATEADGLPNPDPGARFTVHLSVAEAF